VIAALAFSCAPPLEETGYDWDAANARNDASKTDSLTDSLVSSFGAGSSVSAKNPTFDVTFPVESDFLREDNFAASLKGFLTVNTFTNPAANPDGNDGVLSTLISVDYTVENRAGNKVTLKVDKDYTAAADYSNLVIKIDSTKYKHSHGLLLDGDRNGKAGEAGYDDVYLTQGLSGATITGATLPGNKGWSIAISQPSFGSFASDTATSTTAATVYAVNISTNSSISTTSTKGKAIYAEIADLVKNNIKIERLGTNGAWTAESATAEYDTTVSVTYILFKNFTATHGAVYRVTWSGSANLTSSGDYFGVKQRIRLSGSEPNTSTLPTKVLYSLTKVSGSGVAVNNDDLAQFIPSGSFSTYVTTTGYSYDSEKKNVVLKVKLPASPELYWKTVSLADFKKSFQIVYSLSSGGVYNGTTDLAYVDVKGIEFKAEGSLAAPPSGPEKGKNVLYITLDPNFAFDANAETAYKNWQDRRDAWIAYQQYSSALQQYQSALSNYQNNLTQYYMAKLGYDAAKTEYETAKTEYDTAKDAWDTANDAYQQYWIDLANYQDEWNTWYIANQSWSGTAGDGQPGDPDLEPQPPTYVQPPGPAPVEPVEPTPPTQPIPPTQPTPVVDYAPLPGTEPAKGIDLYFRVNDGISVSDNAATNPTVYIFGSPGNFAYDFFEFYDVF
jgi:hypothetical protein